MPGQHTVHTPVTHQAIPPHLPTVGGAQQLQATHGSRRRRTAAGKLGRRGRDDEDEELDDEEDALTAMARRNGLD